jgi:hypothetical protein
MAADEIDHSSSNVNEPVSSTPLTREALYAARLVRADAQSGGPIRRFIKLHG